MGVEDAVCIFRPGGGIEPWERLQHAGVLAISGRDGGERGRRGVGPHTGGCGRGRHERQSAAAAQLRGRRCGRRRQLVPEWEVREQ